MLAIFRNPFLKKFIGRIGRDDFLINSSSNILASKRSYCTLRKDVLSEFDSKTVDKYINFLTSTYKSQNSDFEKNFEDYSYLQTRNVVHNLDNISKKNDEAIQLSNMLKEYAEDTDMKSLINLELESLQSDVSTLKNEIIMELLNPTAKIRSRDVVFEVNAGVGGQEAMLFTQEVFEMYEKYFNYKGWQYSVSSQDTEIGGLRHATIIVSGTEVYQHLQFEGGVHRVQRVPKTEKASRPHTSTMTVVVLVQPDEIEVKITPKDIKIETCKASGKGGQHVNTTDSAVRIVHLPTGIFAECQEGRSQIKNKELALKILRSRIFEAQQSKVKQDIRSSRLLQVTSANRNDKIRTYNFKDDRVTDHRIGQTVHNLDSLFDGGKQLDDFIMVIRDEFKKEYLIEKMKNVK